jgi:hypothetical protein
MAEIDAISSVDDGLAYNREHSGIASASDTSTSSTWVLLNPSAVWFSAPAKNRIENRDPVTASASGQVAALPIV